MTMSEREPWRGTARPGLAGRGVAWRGEAGLGLAWKGDARIF
jgi:hypothetical protein